MKSLSTSALLYSILVIFTAAEAAEGIVAGQELTPDPTSISFLFWNDTADAERFFKEGWRYAPDDYLTTSFGLEYRFHRRGRPWKITSHLNVITLKDLGTRTDLFSLHLETRFRFQGLQIILSGGVMGNGNFGGASIQNAYHRLRHHRELKLAYPVRNRFGPSLGVEIRGMIQEMQRSSVSARFSSLSGFTAGYHRYRSLFVYSHQLSTGIQAEAVSGYSGYVSLHESLEPVFEAGVTYGAAFTWSIHRNLILSGWIYANLYRRDQTIPGVSITFGAPAGEGLLSSIGIFP